jgi:hypothetical protein
MNHGERSKWSRAPLSALGILISGQSPASRFVNHEGRGTPYVSGPEQWTDKRVVIDKWTTSAAKIAPERSIFIVMKGASVGMVFPGTTAAIGRDIAAFVPYKPLDREFMTIALRERCKSLVGDARGPIPGLSRSMLLDLWLDMPPLAEQARIAEKTRSAADDTITAALLGQLGTGDAADEDADALLSRLEEDVDVQRVEASAEAEEGQRTRAVSVSRLVETVRASGTGLSPERLFATAGYQMDAVDVFYSHIKAAVTADMVRYDATTDSVVANET